MAQRDSDKDGAERGDAEDESPEEQPRDGDGREPATGGWLLPTAELRREIAANIADAITYDSEADLLRAQMIDNATQVMTPQERAALDRQLSEMVEDHAELALLGGDPASIVRVGMLNNALGSGGVTDPDVTDALAGALDDIVSGRGMLGRNTRLPTPSGPPAPIAPGGPGVAPGPGGPGTTPTSPSGSGGSGTTAGTGAAGPGADTEGPRAFAPDDGGDAAIGGLPDVPTNSEPAPVAGGSDAGSAPAGSGADRADSDPVGAAGSRDTGGGGGVPGSIGPLNTTPASSDPPVRIISGGVVDDVDFEATEVPAGNPASWPYITGQPVTSADTGTDPNTGTTDDDGDTGQGGGEDDADGDDTAGGTGDEGGSAVAYVDPEMAGDVVLGTGSLAHLEVIGRTVIDTRTTNTGAGGGPLDLGGVTPENPNDMAPVAHVVDDDGGSFGDRLHALDLIEISAHGVFDVTVTDTGGGDGPGGLDPATFDPSTLPGGGLDAHDGADLAMGDDPSGFGDGPLP